MYMVVGVSARPLAQEEIRVQQWRNGLPVKSNRHLLTKLGMAMNGKRAKELRRAAEQKQSDNLRLILSGCAPCEFSQTRSALSLGEVAHPLNGLVNASLSANCTRAVYQGLKRQMQSA